jgi:hypothetical protein
MTYFLNFLFNYLLSSSGRKWRLCVPISIETVEVTFFVIGLETLQIQGVEMSTGGPTESFEAFLTIYLSQITQNIS